MNNKYAFWQALVFTVMVFVLGIFLGFFLENSRADKIQLNLMNSEINLLDEQLRNKVTDDLNVECNLAISSTFAFADKIYSEALNLEKYDSANKFDDNLKALHRRYDLLRTMLWLESINLRERCNGNFHTIVYFYQYGVDDVDIDAKQNFYGRLLEDLKNKYPGEVLLIPIAANLDLASVDLAIGEEEIGKLPAILIDEERIVDSIITFEDLENIIFGNNN